MSRRCMEGIGEVEEKGMEREGEGGGVLRPLLKRKEMTVGRKLEVVSLYLVSVPVLEQ